MYVPGCHVLFHTVYTREIQFCESAILSLALLYFTHGLWDLLKEYIELISLSLPLSPCRT